MALTRAEERLVFSSFEPHQRGSSTSWYQRLKALATELPTPVPVGSAAPSADAGFSLACMPPCSPPDPVTSLPSRLSHGTQEDDTLQAETATRIGLALHRLLQWHPTPAAGFEWTSLHLEAAGREFGLSQAQMIEVAAMARRIVSGPAAWAWDDGALTQWGNEVELFHRGQLLRLDRLVRQRESAASPATWWVLDFKSAQQPEQQADLLAQMAGYRDALAAANPGESVRLAFINPLGALIDVTDRLPASRGAAQPA